jgi:hypothetical protein
LLFYGGQALKGATAVEILMAIAGAVSLYLGYRLFCDSAYHRGRVRHLISGALLAVFGLAILFASAQGLRRPSHHPHLVPDNLLRYSTPLRTRGIVRFCRYSDSRDSRSEVKGTNERIRSKAGFGV